MPNYDDEAFQIMLDTFKAIPDLPQTFYDAEIDNPPHTLFLHYTNIPGDTVTAGAGASRRFRTVGLVQISLYIPVGYGDKEATLIHGKIADAFEGRAFSGSVISGLRVEGVSLQRGAAQARSGRHVQWNVLVPYNFDKVRSQSS